MARALTPLAVAFFLTCPAAFSAERVFEGDATPRLLQENGAGEGPAWHPQLGLLTSGGDGHIWRRDRDGNASIHRKDAGSNGLMFDRQGRLVLCEPVRRRVSRVEADGTVTVLADSYDGKKFNQPNDLTIDSKGRIYFTDPQYGDRSRMELVDAQGRKIEGVYRIDPEGKVTRVITHEVDRPNGLVVTHDDRFLFVADNNNSEPGAARKLWRFDLKPDGTVDFASQKLIHDWKSTRGPDGMKLDAKGRLYVAAGLNKPNPPVETQEKPTAGVYVFSPEGALLEFAPIPRDETTNVAFGDDDLKTLYVTAGGTLWRLRTTTPGKPAWPTLDAAGASASPPYLDPQKTPGRLTVVAGTRPNGEPLGGALKEPFGVVTDDDGNLFLVELSGGRVLRMTADGALSVIAGNGSKGAAGDGGPAGQAVFNGMHNLTRAENGDLYISDTWNQKIRKIDGKTGFASTVAGTGKKGFSGDGGPAIAADCGGLYCVTLDAKGRRLLVADLDNKRIRSISLESGRIETLAGNGSGGVPKDGEPAVRQPLVDPRAVAADSKGNVYVLERGGHALRVVKADGRIFTVAGTGKAGPPKDDVPALEATLNGPKHLCVDGRDNVIIADAENNVVVAYLPATGRVIRIAGTGKAGSGIIGRTPRETELARPHGVHVDARGTLFIVDTYHDRVLKWEP